MGNSAGLKEGVVTLDDAISIYSDCIDEFESRLDVKFDESIKKALLSASKKWEHGIHICMNVYVLSVLCKIPGVGREHVNEFAMITLPMEAVIQSLDDTIDMEHRNKQLRWNDDLVKFFSLSYLFLKLYDVQKKDYADSIFSTILHSEPKVIRILDTLVLDVLKYTNIPFVEKECSEAILAADSKFDEEKHALRCYFARADAIMFYFDLLNQILVVDKDSFGIVSEMLRLKRGMELVRKDISDIPDDLKQGSVTPVTSFYSKYGYSQDFEKRVLSIQRKLMVLARAEKSKLTNSEFVEAVDYVEFLIEEELKATQKILLTCGL